MTAKEYLREARRLKVAINGKTDRMEQLRSIAEGVTSSMPNTPRGSGDPQRMARVVETIVDFSREIAEETAPLVELQRIIQAAINQIERQDYRTVLELYYLNGYRWDEVARKMGYSVQHIYRMHGKALESYEKVESK